MRGRVIASMLARALEQLDQDPARGSRVQEGDPPFHPVAGRAIDKLDATAREAIERGAKIGHLETEVVHRRASTFRQEPRDARLAVGRLEQLDARLILCDEHDAHALLRNGVLRPDRVAQDVAIERDRVRQRGHDDADVVQRTRTGGRDHPLRGSYTPNTPRRSSLTSPSVTPARTAASISGTRFAVPRAAATRSDRARVAAPAARRARQAFTSSARRRARASSTPRSCGCASSPPSPRYAFTPTTTCSPLSTARCWR